MKQLVCIGCPRGCRLTIDENNGEYTVTGNTCPRGKEFAISEMTAPKRTICSTVKTVFSDVPVLPVRVSDDIPKKKIFDVMREINAVTLKERIGRGDAVNRIDPEIPPVEAVFCRNLRREVGQRHIA